MLAFQKHGGKIVLKNFHETSSLTPSVSGDYLDYSNNIFQTFLCLRNLSILSHLSIFSSCNMNITTGIYKFSKSFANKWDKFPGPNPGFAKVKGYCETGFWRWKSGLAYSHIHAGSWWLLEEARWDWQENWTQLYFMLLHDYYTIFTDIMVIGIKTCTVEYSLT